MMSLGKVPDFFVNLSGNKMNGDHDHSYCFESFRLDVEERRLLRKNIPVTLEPRIFDVLVHLVQNNGHLVEKEKLLNTIWADSFVEETNIARAVHILRKVLGEGHNGKKFIETVATKGYRFVAEVTDATELHEWDADTLKRTANGDEGFPDTTVTVKPVMDDDQVRLANPVIERKRPSRGAFFTVGFVTAVSLILLLSFDFWQRSAAGPVTTRSLAVLPLKPINSANRDEIYEIGIADSLIHVLSTMKGLVVRPLSATRKYADIDQDAVAAGREQKVDYILASNYQLSEGKIRITAQLFNMTTGQIEETYKIEKDAANLFAMQDAIGRDLGTLLQTRFATTFNAPAKRGTTNEEAYRLYLQGRLLTTKVNAQAQKKAIEYFEQAIELDPNYALAYARMASAYFRLDLLSNDLPRAELSKEIIKKAFELDVNLPEAYVARGQLHLAYEWNLPEAEKDLIRAIELEPNNDTAHWLYALLLAARKHFDEALTEIETAQSIDPSATQYMMHRGRILLYARRYDEAVVQFERMMDLDPDNFSNWMQYAYEMKGDEARAYEIFMKLQERWESEHREVYPRIYETGGWQAVKRKALEFAKLDVKEGSGNPFNVAREFAMLGDKDEAFEFLNIAIERRKWLVYNLDVEPAFDALRGDPRFGVLLSRIVLR